MRQNDIDKQLATMRAKIAELERQNREQVAIIRFEKEHIADLRADIEFYHKLINFLMGIDNKPKPAKCKIT